MAEHHRDNQKSQERISDLLRDLKKVKAPWYFESTLQQRLRRSTNAWGSFRWIPVPAYVTTLLVVITAGIISYSVYLDPVSTPISTPSIPSGGDSISPQQPAPKGKADNPQMTIEENTQRGPASLGRTMVEGSLQDRGPIPLRPDGSVELEGQPGLQSAGTDDPRLRSVGLRESKGGVSVDSFIPQVPQLPDSLDSLRTPIDSLSHPE